MLLHSLLTCSVSLGQHENLIPGPFSGLSPSRICCYILCPSVRRSADDGGGGAAPAPAPPVGPPAVDCSSLLQVRAHGGAVGLCVPVRATSDILVRMLPLGCRRAGACPTPLSPRGSTWKSRWGRCRRGRTRAPARRGGRGGGLVIRFRMRAPLGLCISLCARPLDICISACAHRWARACLHALRAAAGRYGGLVSIRAAVAAATPCVVLNALGYSASGARVVSDGGGDVGPVALLQSVEYQRLVLQVCVPPWHYAYPNAGIMRIRMRRAAPQLPAPLAAGDHVTVNVSFVGALESNMHGLYLSSYADAGGAMHYIVATQFEATHARRAFPCMDEPAFKAVFQVRVNGVPPGFTALGNMPPAWASPDGASVLFAPSVPMSVYAARYAYAFPVWAAIRQMETRMRHAATSSRSWSASSST